MSINIQKPISKHRKRPRDIVSYNMSRIKSSGSLIERKLGSAMHSLSLRYRKQYPIVGKPDFAFVSAKVAVFCDSSFWHGRYWEEGAREEIKTNKGFWIPKIERNIERDKEVNHYLKQVGWLVLRFWDDDIKSNPTKCAEVVKRAVEKRKNRKS